MKISKRTDYALRALFTLVEYYGRGPIPIRELARRNDVPKRFLEQIMLDLKAQGWVESTAGVRGGYVLARNPAKITMGEVVRHFDGILAPIACVSVTGYERCSQEPVCRFRRVFLEARNYAAGLMDKATLAQVAKGQPVTGKEVFAPGFVRRRRYLTVIRWFSIAGRAVFVSWVAEDGVSLHSTWWLTTETTRRRVRRFAPCYGDSTAHPPKKNKNNC